MKTYSILILVFASLIFSQVGFAQEAPVNEKTEKVIKEKAKEAKAKKKGAIDNTMFKRNPEMEASRKKANDAKNKNAKIDPVTPIQDFKNNDARTDKIQNYIPKNYGLIRSEKAKAKVDSVLVSKHSSIKRSSELIDEAYLKIAEAKKALAQKIKSKSISRKEIELEQAKINRAEEKVKRLEIKLDSALD